MDAIEALRLIAELDKPLEATSPNDWRRRVQLIARIALGVTESPIAYGRVEDAGQQSPLPPSPNCHAACD